MYKAGSKSYSSLPLPAYSPFVIRKVPITPMPTRAPLDKSIEVTPSKRREVLAWGIILVQTLTLVCLFQGTVRQHSLIRGEREDLSLTMNEKPFFYHYERFLGAKRGNTTRSFYEPPTIYPPNSATLVSRVWHSNKSPSVNDGLKTGSCWCSVDDYCMCTPMLGVDVILTSSDKRDVWLVKRKDTGKLALAGGYVEVGESVEEACRREVNEELGIDLLDYDSPLNLIGVYSDPRRDSRKHSVSTVYHLELPWNSTFTAGDDAMEVIRFPLSGVENLESMHTDHKTVLLDFINNHMSSANDDPGVTSPIKRSICRK